MTTTPTSTAAEQAQRLADVLHDLGGYEIDLLPHETPRGTVVELRVWCHLFPTTVVLVTTDTGYALFPKETKTGIVWRQDPFEVARTVDGWISDMDNQSRAACRTEVAA